MKPEDFLKIKNWLLRNGRILDYTRFAFQFEDIDPVYVVEALKAYQNPDGGFGHGLEPDLWDPQSSPIQTWAVLEVIEETGIPDDHELVINLIDYLIHKAERIDGKWLTLHPAFNDHPHAPWWHYEKENRIWGYNPTAALAGFCFWHTNPSSEVYSIALKLSQEAVAYFLENDITEPHELSCFVELYSYIACREQCESFGLFTEKLRQQILKTVEKDEKKWFSAYSVKPSVFVKSPKDAFYPDLKELIEKEVGLLLKNRNAEGVWDVTWSWGQFPNAEAIALREWQGAQIIKNLKLLKAFGKL